MCSSSPAQGPVSLRTLISSLPLKQAPGWSGLKLSCKLHVHSHVCLQYEAAQPAQKSSGKWGWLGFIKKFFFRCWMKAVPPWFDVTELCTAGKIYWIGLLSWWFSNNILTLIYHSQDSVKNTNTEWTTMLTRSYNTQKTLVLMWCSYQVACTRCTLCEVWGQAQGGCICPSFLVY